MRWASKNCSNACADSCSFWYKLYFMWPACHVAQVFMRMLYTSLVLLVTAGTKEGLGTLWAPTFLRGLVTNFLLHIGGVHSGCGIGSLIWLIYAAVYLAIEHHLFTIWVKIFGYALMAIVTLTCFSATPALRFKLHNLFEHAHRYTGWAALVVMLIFIILLYGGPDYRWRNFLGSYWLWLSLVTLVLVALPWCCVSKVPVVAEIPASKRITLLKFQGYVRTGLYGRISRGPLSEWHVFGCFSQDRQENSHYMICSAVGDFTKALVEQPPEYMYTRLIKFPGFSYCHRMYHSGVAICTGAAIGVFISLFSNKGLTNFSLIWVGSSFEKTYGLTVVQMLRKGCPENKLTLYDTSVNGRPNLVDLVVDAYRKQKAEVVFCVSNLAGTKSIVQGCRRHGIQAFGPVWDA